MSVEKDEVGLPPKGGPGGQDSRPFTEGEEPGDVGESGGRLPNSLFENLERWVTQHDDRGHRGSMREVDVDPGDRSHRPLVPLQA
jgi:hypothetical protein